MDINTWKGLHKHDTGHETVRLLIEEVEDMTRARYNAQCYPHGLLGEAYWVKEERHHADRVAWLEKKLGGMLERRGGSS